MSQYPKRPQIPQVSKWRCIFCGILYPTELERDLHIVNNCCDTTMLTIPHTTSPTDKSVYEEQSLSYGNRNHHVPNILPPAPYNIRQPTPPRYSYSYVPCPYNLTPTPIHQSQATQPLVAEVGPELCRVKLEGGSMGGYKCDILTENLSGREINSYKCPKCEGIMKDGVISNTGPQLCKCCLKKDEKALCDAPIRISILSLKCCCPLSKRGCDWLGRLESVENHLTTCGRVHVSCELRCEVVTSRGGMGRHVGEECSQREEACLHCSGVHKVCEMEEHVKVCGKVAVMCELGCGTRVCRDSILRHRENECPEETVMCPYEKFRCEVVGLKRRELKQHLDDNRIIHMELKFNSFEEKIKIENRETKLKHKSLVERVESHTKKIEILESKLKSKDKEIAFLETQVFLVGEETVKFTIKNISACFKPNQGISTKNRSEHFGVAGYKFCFCYTSDVLNFNISFAIIDSLELPLRATFITRMVCHRDTKKSLIMKSPILEIEKEDTHKIKQICHIPLSTDLKDFIREDSLDLEVTLRILKNK